jgi:hypothetical protein
MATRKSRKRARDAQALPQRPAHPNDIKITKLDAAQRQLRAAIKLWFEDGDPVSIHTLIAASHEITHTLFKRKGLNDLLFDSRLIKDEYRNLFARLTRAAATFFKHAQRDPDDVHTFNPLVNESLILFTIKGLRDMGEAASVEEDAFMHWNVLHNPKLLTAEGLRFYTDALPVNFFEVVNGMEKREFFEIFDLLRQGFSSAEVGRIMLEKRKLPR